MAISAIPNSGSQPPSLASLLQINRVNPIAGRDSDDANGVSGIILPKAGAKSTLTPKLVQDVLKTLSQLGANPGAKAEGLAVPEAKDQDIKKTVMDFLSSVVSAAKPKAEGALSKEASPLEQLNVGISKMIGEISSGASFDAAVAQSADKLLRVSGVQNNANNLSSLLEGLQKSLMDGLGAGSLINFTA